MSSTPPATARDIWKPVDRRPLGKLPKLVLSAARLLWEAAPREFTLVALVQLLSGLAAGVQLVLIKNLIAALLAAGSGSDFAVAVPWFLGLAALTLVTSFSNSVQWELQRLLGQLAERHASTRIFDVAAAADLETFETPEFHNRLERAWLSGSVRPVQAAQSVLGLIGTTASVLALLVALYTVAPVLVLLIGLGAIPVLLITARGTRALHDFNWSIAPLDRRRMYLGRVLTYRQHAHEVISFDLAGFLRARWERSYDEKLVQLRQVVRSRLRLGLVAAVGQTLLLVVPVGLIAYLLVSGVLQIPQAVTAATGALLLRPSLQGLLWSATQLYECALFLDDYAGFVQVKSELTSARGHGQTATAFETLALDHVSFTYPTALRPAVCDVSLRLRSGEVVALVGENGSGKTTLAKLLSGLYRPTAGRVLWDGIDADDLEPRSRRRLVAVLFQDFCQYLLSVRENIGVGNHERANDDAAIGAAAAQAGADQFIQDLPEGYETLLGPEFEGGANLSVGQWQRLALARAYLRDAPLVILDEPTASLDARAEHELFDAMRSLFRGRTVLLISHRFSSVRSADSIYVLRKGRLVEHGTHQELLSRGGLYAELFMLQARAYQADGEVLSGHGSHD